MQNILQQWQDLSRDDLFIFWKNEIRLKKDLRQVPSEYSECKINSPGEYLFLRQSLAYGKYKPVFLRILFLNMDSLLVQNELLNGPLHLYREFLRQLPHVMLTEQTAPQNLQFLINLYREDFAPFFEDIVAVLDETSCEYLLQRTANKGLRQILKQRQSRLRQAQSEIHYGLLPSTQHLPAFPTLFGDKIDLLTHTVQLLAAEPGTHSTHPFDYLNLYLEAAEHLFMLGMISESVAMLHSVYQQWLPLRPNFLWEDNINLSKSLNRILGKTLAIFALLNNSTPYPSIQEVYHQYFPELLPDQTVLLYLNLMQNLLLKQYGNCHYSFIEMTNIFNQSEVPKEDILAAYFRNCSPLEHNHLHLLFKDIDRDMTALPHRALVTMYILLFLVRENKIILSKSMASHLLKNHLILYKWIPTTCFLNHGILEQLSRSADVGLQNEAQQLLEAADKFTKQSVRNLYIDHPDLFQGENNLLMRQMLLSSFLGVM